VELPWRGVTNALIRARIPYLPVHVDHLERDASKFSLLILPNYGAMSDALAASIRRFVERGGGLVATGHTSLYNEWGEPRADYALADLFGAHAGKTPPPADALPRRRTGSDTQHTYLRLAPELRARVYGPKAGTEPAIMASRHPVLRGFDDTDILPFGGILEPLRLDPHASVLATFIPSFPIYPPETAWIRQPKTDIPGLILNTSHKGRVAFIPADLDRRFATDNLPDHGNLLANLVRWAANDRIPLQVEGPGLIDCHLYRQENRLILHLVNLTSTGTWRQPMHELISVGPLRVKIELPSEVRPRSLQLLVARKKTRFAVRNGWVQFEVSSVLDHEVGVVG